MVYMHVRMLEQVFFTLMEKLEKLLTPAMALHLALKLVRDFLSMALLEISHRHAMMIRPVIKWGITDLPEKLLTRAMEKEHAFIPELTRWRFFLVPQLHLLGILRALKTRAMPRMLATRLARESISAYKVEEETESSLPTCLVAATTQINAGQ